MKRLTEQELNELEHISMSIVNQWNMDNLRRTRELIMAIYNYLVGREG